MNQIKAISRVSVVAVVLAVFFTGSVEGADTGIASFYGAGEPLNSHTAMNIPFDARLMECASWEHPLGAVLVVTSLRTGKSVVVRVTDRGPARRLNRIVDLTRDAFSQIDELKLGLTRVRVNRIK